MLPWQKVLIGIYATGNFVFFIKALYETKYKKNAYGLVRPLVFLGIFVWGDAVVFGPFWILASVVSLVLDNLYLFLLILSVFWVVRSLGETIYWFNQQFSPSLPWNKPEKLPWHSIFHDESVWFIHQIGWQCWTVISIIFAIYFAALWLKTVI